jgi:excisionase family DNA binding protein
MSRKGNEMSKRACRSDYVGPMATTGNDIVWLSTGEASSRLGITTRTLYRFIDEGLLPAYRFGRVIRLQQAEVDSFILRSRIEPGTLDHLYPEVASSTSDMA